ncbi:MAG: tetratricopeptide repeat protein [Methylophagaceae bacterium]
MQKNSFSFILTVTFILLLSACASKPVGPDTPIETKAERLEKRAQADTLKRDYPNATKSASDSLRLFSLLDDQQGQLRLHLNLTRLYLLQNQRDKAERHLAKAKTLTQEIDASQQRYQIHLLSGKLNDNRAEFEQARDTANSSIEQAVAETYLQNYERAHQLISTAQPASAVEEDDYAFVQLHYARFADDNDSAKSALALYKRNENTVGISDSLYVLATIAKKQGDNDQARQYLQRALEVNIAMGDKKRINATVKALDAQ